MNIAQFSKSFGAALAQTRFEMGMSQAQLAKLTGRTQQGVAKWEAGESLPTRKSLSRMVLHLGLFWVGKIDLPAADEFSMAKDRASILAAALVRHMRSLADSAMDENGESPALNNQSMQASFPATQDALLTQRMLLNAQYIHGMLGIELARQIHEPQPVQIDLKGLLQISENMIRDIRSLAQHQT